MTFLGKGLQQYNNNNTTKQQTQDYETTRRRYATRRLKIMSLYSSLIVKLPKNIFPKFALIIRNGGAWEGFS